MWEDILPLGNPNWSLNEKFRRQTAGVPQIIEDNMPPRQPPSRWEWQFGKFADDMLLGMAALGEKAGIAPAGRARSQYDDILGKASLPPAPNKSLALPDMSIGSPGKFMDDVVLGAAAIGEMSGIAPEGRALSQWQSQTRPNAIERSAGNQPVAGQELWQRPASAAPWYQKTLDDITGMSQGMAAGSAASSALNEVLARQPVNLDPSVTGARPYNPLDTGMQASPYGVTDNLMERAPVHTLGVSGFRTGWSRPTVDYGGMMERSRIENQNMRMAEMLGRQEMAHNAQSNENVRTAMAVQQRDDAARAMAEQRFFGNLNRVPEGKRTPLISEGLTRGFVDPVVGGDMLLDEMLLRARMNAKTGSGIDLKRLLGSIASEFDPNKLSRLDLISKLQRMGYTADQIAAHENDPVVGQFAGSLLSAKPTTRSAREEWESVLFGR